MFPGFKMQDFVPVPTGSNPLWLEKKEEKQRIIRILSIVAIIALFAAAYMVVRDYTTTKGPMDFECKQGFKDTGCPSGYKCTSAIVKCVETNKTFKYRLTSLVFPKKQCNAAEGYREFCVKDVPATEKP